MDKAIKGEGIVGLQPEATGGHASTRVGPISSIGAALHNLIHLRLHRKTAVEASAETGRERKPESGLGASRSPMDAGIAGGFSLLMDNPHARKRP